MCPIPILPRRPPRRTHRLYPLHPYRPSPTSYWLASNAASRCQWLRAANLTPSTALPNASWLSGLMPSSIPHLPMALVHPRTNTRTPVDPMAMLARMGSHTLNIAPILDSTRRANTERCTRYSPFVSAPCRTWLKNTCAH